MCLEKKIKTNAALSLFFVFFRDFFQQFIVEEEFDHFLYPLCMS